MEKKLQISIYSRKPNIKDFIYGKIPIKLVLIEVLNSLENVKHDENCYHQCAENMSKNVSR